jgi:hypothetical protein
MGCAGAATAAGAAAVTITVGATAAAMSVTEGRGGHQGQDNAQTDQRNGIEDGMLRGPNLFLLKQRALMGGQCGDAGADFVDLRNQVHGFLRFRLRGRPEDLVIFERSAAQAAAFWNEPVTAKPVMVGGFGPL